MKTLKTNKEIMQAISDSDNLVIKAGTSHCGMCNLMEERILEVQKEHDNFDFCVIDTEDCDDDVLDEWGIAGIPTIIFVKQGKVIYKMIRPAEKEKIEEIISRF